ncbi:MAG: peptidylprolyl isomerase [Bacteroidales bacterium]
MRKQLINIFVVALLLIMGTSSLYAQKYENGLIDKTIALIGNEMIMLSQLEGEIKMMEAQGVAADRNTRCQVLENMLAQKLFLNQARLDSLNVKEDQVEMELQSRIAQVTTQLGGEKATEEYFKQPMHKLKQDWRVLLRDQSLTQQMQQTVMQKAGSMTPSQVEKFYKKTDKDSLPIISIQYKLSQIVIYPNKVDAALGVKERLLEFRDRILKGERFSTLASLYSEDPGSAIRGGELRMASKDIYWPAFSDAAMALKEGQISQIVETPEGFHLIQMVEKDGNMFNARHILLKPKYTSLDRDKAFKTLDSIKHKISVDSITFEMAARFYSFDPKSAVNGGQMSDGSTGSLYFEKDQLKPMDFSMLKEMKPGDISDPFESTDTEGKIGSTIYKIIRLDKIIPAHTASFKEDYVIIQNVANSTLQQEAIGNFIKEKQAATYIRIDDLFKNCNFEREGWFK